MDKQEIKELICKDCKNKERCEFKDTELEKIDFKKCIMSKREIGDFPKGDMEAWLFVLLAIGCWGNKNNDDLGGNRRGV